MNKSEYEFWLNLPETREVIDCLKKEINDTERSILHGSAFSKDTLEEVASTHISDVSYLRGLQFFSNAIFGYIPEDKK